MSDPDPRIADILEIAVYLCSGDLKQKYQIASLVIYHADFEIGENDYVRERFRKTTLLQEMTDPTKSVPIKEAEAMIIKQLNDF